MKFCKLADITDWQDPEFQATSSMLKCGDRSRKAWEFIQIYQGLNHLGLLNGEANIIGLGVGHECLIYAFTNVCQGVIATDLYESQEWSTAAMAVQEVYDRNPFPYQPNRLTVQHMDMTQIEYPDASFDFVWSCCAIEHVNNFRDLHKVYQEIHRVLKPGGIAALTTEFNNTDRPSYEPNLLFTDRKWMDIWLTGSNPLVQGFELIEPLDFEISDRPENQPISRKHSQGTIQVYCNDIVLNSVAFFLRKSGEFSRPYDEQWLSPFWRDYLAACDAYRTGEFSHSEALLKQTLQTQVLEPRLRVRTLRRLADTLYVQNKFDEVRQVCQTALPDCEVFQDEDQLMPLAVYCWQVGLEAEATTLYEKVEKLPSSNVDLVIQSRLAQAKYYEHQGDFERALDLIGKAEQEILPGAHTEAKYQPQIYFRTGFAYEKMDKLAAAIQFYKRAIAIAAPNTEFQTSCYRRLTACLQTQLKRSKERVVSLEAVNHSMQSSKFWKLRSKWMTMKHGLKRWIDPSPNS